MRKISLLALSLAFSLVLASPSPASSLDPTTPVTSTLTASPATLATQATLSTSSRQAQVPQLDQPVETQAARSDSMVERSNEAVDGGDGEMKRMEEVAGVEKRWQGEQALLPRRAATPTAAATMPLLEHQAICSQVLHCSQAGKLRRRRSGSPSKPSCHFASLTPQADVRPPSHQHARRPCRSNHLYYVRRAAHRRWRNDCRDHLEGPVDADCARSFVPHPCTSSA